jgi:hypothetical protein
MECIVRRRVTVGRHISTPEHKNEGRTANVPDDIVSQ